MDPIISVQNLTKKFKDFTAVDDITFDIKKGEIFGFLGPNGAGKSTTIRILTTLLRPTSGNASVSGHDILKDPDEVRKHIGLIAEKIILYNNLTAKENLEFFGGLYGLNKSEIKARTDKWIDRLHMREWLDTRVSAFSTGMQQRINIVRALLTEPEILFMDEPTLGLDPQTTNLIRTFVNELNKGGMTILLTTHDMLEAEALSDRVAIIDHGKIAAIDNIDKLIEDAKKKHTDKGNPTLEDVFLDVTGKDIRDFKQKGSAGSGAGHMFRPVKGNNRIR